LFSDEDDSGKASAAKKRKLTRRDSSEATLSRTYVTIGGD